MGSLLQKLHKSNTQSIVLSETRGQNSGPKRSCIVKLRTFVRDRAMAETRTSKCICPTTQRCQIRTPRFPGASIRSGTLPRQTRVNQVDQHPLHQRYQCRFPNPPAKPGTTPKSAQDNRSAHLQPPTTYSQKALSHIQYISPTHTSYPQINNIFSTPACSYHINRLYYISKETTMPRNPPTSAHSIQDGAGSGLHKDHQRDHIDDLTDPYSQEWMDLCSRAPGRSHVDIDVKTVPPPQPLSKEFLQDKEHCCNSNCINCPYPLPTTGDLQ